MKVRFHLLPWSCAWGVESAVAAASFAALAAADGGCRRPGRVDRRILQNSAAGKRQNLPERTETNSSYDSKRKTSARKKLNWVTVTQIFEELMSKQWKYASARSQITSTCSINSTSHHETKWNLYREDDMIAMCSLSLIHFDLFTRHPFNHHKWRDSR